jgi:hypothetical protein
MRKENAVARPSWSTSALALALVWDESRNTGMADGERLCQRVRPSDRGVGQSGQSAAIVPQLKAIDSELLPPE